MHGFSYINSLDGATVHLSLVSDFDQSDIEEIDKFIKDGHHIVELYIRNIDNNSIASDLLFKLGGTDSSKELLWARMVDALISASETYTGLLIVVKLDCSLDFNITFKIVEFIEYFLVSYNAWKEAGKPYHLVICDSLKDMFTNRT